MLLLNDGAGNFTLTMLPSGITSGIYSPIMEIALGDVNGDNHLDIEIGGSEILLNDGKGGFVSNLLPGQREWKLTESIALGDVDNDGQLDIILGNFGQNQILLNDGTGDFNVFGLPGFIRRTCGIALIDVNKMVTLISSQEILGRAW